MGCNTSNVYICDPKKNYGCSKTHCYINGGECMLTTHKEYMLERTSMKIKVIDYGYTNLPSRKHYNDVGADVYSTDYYTIQPGHTEAIPLGFGIELPDGLAAFVWPRSGMSQKGIICELPPVDPGYTGELHAIITNHSSEPYNISEGDRIGQLVIIPVIIADFVTETGKERGTGAFASTGV